MSWASVGTVEQISSHPLLVNPYKRAVCVSPDVGLEIGNLKAALLLAFTGQPFLGTWT